MGDGEGLKPQPSGNKQSGGFVSGLFKVLGVLGVAIVGVIVGQFADPIRPMLRPFTTWVGDRILDVMDPLPKPQNSDDYVVLIANIEGDDGEQTQATRIAEFVSSAFPNDQGLIPFRVIRYPRVLKIDGEDFRTQNEKRNELGRLWLGATNADLLIWGTAREANDEIQLHFVTASMSKDLMFSFRDQAMRTGVNRPILSQITFQFVLQTLAPALYAFEGGENAMLPAGHLKRVRERLRPLLDFVLDDLTVLDRAQVVHAYAFATEAAFKEDNSVNLINDAIRSYERAIQIISEDSSTAALKQKVWFQGNLSDALIARGTLTKSVGDFTRAIEVRNAAINAAALGLDPEQVAILYDGLGVALFHLGQSTESYGYLDQALMAQSKALKIYTAEKFPLDRAKALQNYTNTLFISAMGRKGELPRAEQMAEGVDTTEEAASLYELFKQNDAALKMRVNACGFAANLVTVRQDDETVTRALHACRVALQRATDSEDYGQAALCNNNFGMMYAGLARVQTDPSLRAKFVAKAVESFSASLEYWTPERDPDWNFRVRHNIDMARGLIPTKS